MFLILEEPEYLEKGNITASGGEKAWFQSYCNLYSYIHITIIYTFCNMKLLQNTKTIVLFVFIPSPQVEMVTEIVSPSPFVEHVFYRCHDMFFFLWGGSPKHSFCFSSGPSVVSSNTTECSEITWFLMVPFTLTLAPNPTKPSTSPEWSQVTSIPPEETPFSLYHIRSGRISRCNYHCSGSFCCNPHFLSRH